MACSDGGGGAAAPPPPPAPDAAAAEEEDDDSGAGTWVGTGGSTGGSDAEDNVPSRLELLKGTILIPEESSRSTTAEKLHTDLQNFLGELNAFQQTAGSVSRFASLFASPPIRVVSYLRWWPLVNVTLVKAIGEDGAPSTVDPDRGGDDEVEGGREEAGGRTWRARKSILKLV